MFGVREKWAIDGNGFAVNLVGPASEIAIARDGERKIGGASNMRGFAVVERFELSELIGVLFDEISELVHQVAALRGAHLSPPPGLKGGASSSHRLIYVGSIGFGDLRDDFAGCGIDGGERFAGSAVYPFAVDQKLGWANFDIWFHRRSCGCHLEPPRNVFARKVPCA